MRRWYPMCADALPAWLPTEFVARRWITAESFFPAALGLLGYRKLGMCGDRNGDLWIHRRWYWYARVELFLLALSSFVVRNLIDQRILVGPEGGWFYEFRLNDPASWRWK